MRTVRVWGLVPTRDGGGRAQRALCPGPPHGYEEDGRQAGGELLAPERGRTRARDGAFRAAAAEGLGYLLAESGFDTHPQEWPGGRGGAAARGRLIPLWMPQLDLRHWHLGCRDAGRSLDRRVERPLDLDDVILIEAGHLDDGARRIGLRAP